MLETLQALYDSEINFHLSTFWDGGFTAKLGDDMNSYAWEGEFDTVQDAVAGLSAAALRLYPDSVFAKKAA